MKKCWLKQVHHQKSLCSSWYISLSVIEMTETNILGESAEYVKMRDEVSMIRLECKKIEAQLRLRELKAMLDKANRDGTAETWFDILICGSTDDRRVAVSRLIDEYSETIPALKDIASAIRDAIDQQTN